MINKATLSLMLVAVLAVPAFAQLGPQRASIPFAFTVGGVALVPGEYNIVPGPSSQTLMIRSVDGSKAAVFIAVGSRWEPGTSSTLRFRMLENGYALQSVVSGETRRELLSFAKRNGVRYASVATTRAGS